MDISSLLSSALNGGAASQIATSLGVDNATAQKLIAIGTPLLLNQMDKNAQTPAGAEAFSKALDKHKKGKTSIDDLTSSESLADGKKIISHILGSDTESTTTHLAQKAGVSPEQASGLLARLAPLLMGALGEQKASNGLDTSAIVGLLSETAGSTSEKSLLSSLATSFLDKNGDGKIQDDIIRMGMNWLKNRFASK